MVKSISYISLSMMALLSIALFFSRCACDAEEFVHEFDISYSLQENEIEAFSSFDMQLIVPDMAVDLVGGDTIDISDLDLEYSVLIREFRADEIPDFWPSFPAANSDFQVDLTSGELIDEELLLVKPVSVGDQKELTIKLSPTRKDTFLIALRIESSTRGSSGAGLGCGSFHTISFLNQNLLLQEYFTDLPDTMENIERAQSFNGLLMLEVK